MPKGKTWPLFKISMLPRQQGDVLELSLSFSEEQRLDLKDCGALEKIVVPEPKEENAEPVAFLMVDLLI